MMALNEESLFKRNICAYGPTTMRSTMCHCMLQLADIKPGDIIVDAMCGGGSIPIEGAISWKNSLFLGGDNHEMAMSRCLQNWVRKNENLNYRGFVSKLRPFPCFYHFRRKLFVSSRIWRSAIFCRQIQQIADLPFSEHQFAESL